MRLNTTPYGRLGLTLEMRAELRAILPDEYSMSLSGYGMRGPFRASLGTTLLPATTTGGGNLTTVWSDVSPYDAAMKAIRTAAGDIEGTLEERLAASIRALGLEPAAS